MAAEAARDGRRERQVAVADAPGLAVPHGHRVGEDRVAGADRAYLRGTRDRARLHIGVSLERRDRVGAAAIDDGVADPYARGLSQVERSAHRALEVDRQAAVGRGDGEAGGIRRERAVSDAQPAELPRGDGNRLLDQEPVEDELAPIQARGTGDAADSDRSADMRPAAA